LASSILHSHIQPPRGATVMVCVAIVSLTLSPLSTASAFAQEPQTSSTQTSSTQASSTQAPSTLTTAPAPTQDNAQEGMLFTQAQAPSFSFDRQQDPPVSSERPWSFWRTTRQVAFDPTTYAPAVISYVATKLDWDTSQVFFRNGYVEGNPRFTISGNPNDTPLGYRTGQRKILSDTLATLGGSMANNFITRTIEQVLIERYPEHPRLVHTIGWIERVSFSSYWSYRLSATHFRQWKANERMAAQNGLQ
jgi:hypothetical protein